MTYLVGAWSLSGVAINHLVPLAHRAAMRAQLPDDRCEEIVTERLWLIAGQGNIARRVSTVVALEGFSAGVAAGKIMQSLKRVTLVPPGHANVVWAAETEGEVTLARCLSGGERLYYSQVGDILLFGASIRYLLAHPAVVASLHYAQVPELLLTGRTLFGAGTLCAGIDEVLPGRRMTWGRTLSADVWHGPDLMQPPQGDITALARAFHDELIEAVVACAGAQRPVAVLLSGGIDSASIAALAVEAFGASNVAAFTYEFDDPGHPCETPFAVEVCRTLGIGCHEIFKLEFRDFLRDIPETIWRAEDISHWPKAFMLQVARQLRSRGFDRVLSGFGIGSHMAYFADLAYCLRSGPQARIVLGLWRYLHRRGVRSQQALDRLHPGLATPAWRLLLPLGVVLRERGLLHNLTDFYPQQAHSIVAQVQRPGSDEQWLREAPLLEVLRRLAFERLISCVDVTRWEKPMRELGLQRLSPAHFTGTLPYAYLPIEPQPFVWGARRRLRPGKLLLRESMRGVLPESVLYRKKFWADAVISPRWFEAGVRWMAGANSDDALSFYGTEFSESAQKWDRWAPGAAVTAFGLWQRIFIENQPNRIAPTWASLAAGLAVRNSG